MKSQQIKFIFTTDGYKLILWDKKYRWQSDVAIGMSKTWTVMGCVAPTPLGITNPIVGNPRLLTLHVISHFKTLQFVPFYI